MLFWFSDPLRILAWSMGVPQGPKQKIQHWYGGSGSWKNRIESESEEEYDSELDDFIDDSDAKIDVSKEIRSIFG